MNNIVRDISTMYVQLSREMADQIERLSGVIILASIGTGLLSGTPVEFALSIFMGAFCIAWSLFIGGTVPPSLDDTVGPRDRTSGR